MTERKKPTSKSRRGGAQARPERVPLQARIAPASVLLLGKTHLARSVARTIRSAALPVARTSTAASVADALDAGTAAVVFVPGPETQRLGAAFGALRAKIGKREVPVILVVGAEPSGRTLRSLYGNGANAVLVWPKDRSALLAALFRIEPLGFIARGSARDNRISKRVKKSLAQESEDLGALNVRVVAGVLVLFGRLDALWKVDVARDLAGATPGVRAVVCEGIEVLPPRLPGRAVASAARGMLKSASEIDPSSVKVSVSEGRLTLSGRVERRREVRRLLDLMRHVRGVRAVENELTVAGKKAQSEKAIAKEIRSTIARDWPEASVEVALFDDVAVLGGAVRQAQHRAGIEALAASFEGVDRVVNRIATGRR